MGAKNAERVAIVLEPGLPPGVAANAAAMLVTGVVGKAPQIVGEDVVDAQGIPFPGLGRCPVVVLKAPDQEALRTLLDQSRASSMVTVAFPRAATRWHKYDEFVTGMRELDAATADYVGVAVYGDTSAVSKLVGSLPLWR